MGEVSRGRSCCPRPWFAAPGQEAPPPPSAPAPLRWVALGEWPWKSADPLTGRVVCTLTATPEPGHCWRARGGAPTSGNIPPQGRGPGGSAWRVGRRTGRASPRGGHTLLPFYSPGAKLCRHIIIQSSQKCGENSGERVSGSQQTKNIFVDFVILLTFKNREFVISFINLSKHLLPKKKKRGRAGVGKPPWLSKG